MPYIYPKDLLIVTKIEYSQRITREILSSVYNCSNLRDNKFLYLWISHNSLLMIDVPGQTEFPSFASGIYKIDLVSEDNFLLTADEIYQQAQLFVDKCITERCELRDKDGKIIHLLR